MEQPSFPRWSVYCLYATGVALGVFLLVQHWVHVSPYIPLLIFLSCPLSHFFMQKAHGHHHSKGDDAASGSGQKSR